MIICVSPKYFAGVGNTATIRDEFGEKDYKFSLNSAIHKIYEERNMNLKVIKKKTAKCLEQKHLIPLFLSAEEVLIPIKVRKPIIIRDGGYAYVNFTFIKTVENNTLVLKDGSTLEYLDSKRSITRRIKMAKILADKLTKNEDLKALKDMDLSLPATKEDILLLVKEIMELKDKFDDLL